MNLRLAPFCALSLILFATPAMAEGDHRPPNKEGYSHEDAARRFEEKARMAEEHGNKEAAELCRKLAAMKRAAAEAEKRGERFDWERFRELNGKLEQAFRKGRENEGECKKPEGDCKKPEGECKKPEEGNKPCPERKPDQGFIEAANHYREQAQRARAEGREKDAYIYNRLAEIKMQAAEAVRNGKNFDWTEYHELKGRLEANRGNCDKRPPEGHRPDGPREQGAPSGGIRVE